MTCTAKCLGDNACITGCFAKYGNAPMNDLLECSIEKNSCIKVAILPPGPDSATEAPAPPLVPVANFDQKTLEGTWYKVMGWNDRYDCFDCQKNSFAPLAATSSPSTTVGEEVASYLEDPHATERWVFAQQQKMGPGDD
ncbi:VDE lipocalin domain-containing protein [Aureococcus anophagefferens]|nr:VDE lipocalin domain-containing protein [Aureococcus anophagefferens]